MRNRYDFAIYRSKLRKAGVELVSATQAIPDGPEGIILESMLEGIAEYYSADLSRKVIDNMTERAEDCQHLGVEVFGYGLGPDGRYVIDESQAPAVRDAFARIAAGEGRASVADALNAAGYRTIRGKPWRTDAVTRMIRNQKYTGVYIWGDVRVEGGMPAIIDSATFRAANDRLKRTPRRRRDTCAQYLLSGLIFDLEGNRLVPDCGRSRTGDYHYYYRSRVSHIAIARDEAEARVRRALADLIAGNPALVDMIVDAVMAEQERAMGSEIDAAAAIAARLPEPLFTRTKDSPSGGSPSGETVKPTHMSCSPETTTRETKSRTAASGPSHMASLWTMKRAMSSSMTMAPGLASRASS